MIFENGFIKILQFNRRMTITDPLETIGSQRERFESLRRDTGPTGEPDLKGGRGIRQATAADQSLPD